MEDNNTEALKTWPERIYLQHGCDDIPNHDEVNSHGAVTWCEDNINELDIEYVRADLVALSSSVTANANMQATSAELDAWIVETVKKANLLCVHPEADTTIDIGRAIVAALSSPATGINMRANEPNVRLDPLLRHPGGYPLDQEDLAWRLWQARATPQPPAPQPAICEDCGDACMEHNPGVCGTCYAMKYRDTQPPADAGNDPIGTLSVSRSPNSEIGIEYDILATYSQHEKNLSLDGALLYASPSPAEQKTEGGEK